MPNKLWKVLTRGLLSLTSLTLIFACSNVGRQAATGAAIGNRSTARRTAGGVAVTGTFTGTLRGAVGGMQDRQRVIRNCLLGRGYRVLNCH